MIDTCCCCCSTVTAHIVVVEWASERTDGLGGGSSERERASDCQMWSAAALNCLLAVTHMLSCCWLCVHSLLLTARGRANRCSPRAAAAAAAGECGDGGSSVQRLRGHVQIDKSGSGEHAACGVTGGQLTVEYSCCMRGMLALKCGLG